MKSDPRGLRVRRVKSQENVADLGDQTAQQSSDCETLPHTGMAEDSD